MRATIREARPEELATPPDGPRVLARFTAEDDSYVTAARDWFSGAFVPLANGPFPVVPGGHYVVELVDDAGAR